MRVHNKKEAVILLLGDALLFFVSLWLALLFRYVEVPDMDRWMTHVEPFSIIFLISVAVFFVAGLYEKHTLILKSKLPSTILNAQAVNTLLAVLLFYLVPYFNIAPKTNLFIYLVISFILITSWRLNGHNVIAPHKKERGVLIGFGDEMHEVFEEVNNNSRYGMRFMSSVDLSEVEEIDFQDEIVNRIYSENIDVIVVDIQNELIEPILPHLYNLLFSDVRFLDLHKVYEEIFDRIPLSLVRYNWFLENISSTSSHKAHDALKRGMDVLFSVVIGVASLFIYPFVVLAILFEDERPVFFKQERVGQNNRPVSVVKFRSMRVPRDERLIDSDELRVTKVGAFLRRTRIDELPQLWNVFKGDVSLIGPRPELPSLAKHYEEEIPYYNIRHLVKPGLSGWSQLYFEDAPYFGPDKDKTKAKLSYDLYYLKNRSFMLDLKIALKTIATIISRKGR